MNKDYYHLLSLDGRRKHDAKAMYDILNELRLVIFLNGGNPDDIMRVAKKAQQIIRRIDNPDLRIELPK